MAKFQSNHKQQKSGAASGMITKVGIFGALIAGLFFAFTKFTGGETTDNGGEEYAPLANYYPKSTSGEIIVHKGFALSYNEEHEQAEWVAELLTRENLEKDWSKRQDNFMPDKAIESGSATPDDYRGSGYDRGHLIPAADLAWDAEAMAETFYMSNISPQAGNFNRGIWRELEELTRNWAKKFKEIYVITGPVLALETKGEIGEGVSVPAAYYKVILDFSEPDVKGIGFVIPNEVSYEPLFKYTKSIDEVEALTGINFFPDLIDESQDDNIESTYNKDLWPFNKKKFETRVNSWNER